MLESTEMTDIISESKDTGINAKLASGAAWMVSFRLIDRFLGVLSTLVLARLLIPEDFGIIAMAMSLVALLEAFGDIGFDVVLIQKQDAKPDHYHSAWTLRVFLGLAIAVILILVRDVAAEFYSEPRLVSLLPLFAFITFVQSLENIGIIDFRKELKFAREFQFQFIKRLISVFITIGLAIALRSYWALAVGMLVSRVVGVGLSYAMHSFRPRFRINRIVELMGFMKWLFLTQVTNFINWRLADFVVGKTAGATGLGSYRVAFEIAMLPTAYVISPVNRAMFSGYSKQAGDLDQLQATFLNVMSLVTLLTIALGFGLIAVADLAVHVMLGPSWAEVGRLLQSLLIFGMTVALMSSIGPVLVARGKPRLGAVLTAAFLIVLIPTLTVLSIRDGAVGAANAYAISGLAVMPLNYWLVCRELELKVTRLLRCFIRPCIAGAGMVLVVVKMQDFVAYSGVLAELGWLVLIAGVGAIAYGLLILALWLLGGREEGAESVLLEWLKSTVARLATRPGRA